MSGWSADELTTIGRAEELQLASRRRDGSLRRFVTLWVVRSGDDIYVRSAYGYDNPWFQRALASGEGRIRVAGIQRDVAFEPAGPDDAAGIDAAAGIGAAYHAKYDRHGPRMVGTVVSPEAVRSTLRVVAR